MAPQGAASGGRRGTTQVVDFWRQKGLLDPAAHPIPPLTLIGAGGIGSPTAICLAKMGAARMMLIDFDTIEPHNLPNQLYRESDLSRPKVEALAELCQQFSTEVEVKTDARKLTDQPLEGVVCSGVDSMAARKEIWARVRMNPQIQLYVEARMGAEVARINTVNPCDLDAVRWYETTLYEDADALDIPCTARAIIYNTFMIASIICSQIKKHVRGEQLPKEVIFDLVTLTILQQ